ncbi:MAG: DUF4126 domain-containing protein [Leptolyngbyaceae cyanobacterium SL_1_1]|nr:DUF4126 domain-containing protein [Leptolyngbyaceae cyanobacterium RM1_1_2]NJO09995.1 DUF4126 domain-containing protein [Leptolyngbyaceae cyanobacterium SL_1_1]
MTELLAVLSISAAVGLRLALPLLLIGLLSGPSLWSNVPILSQLSPSLVVGVLASWSLCELVVSKDLGSRQMLQNVELLFSPFVGAIAGIAIARTVGLSGWLAGLVGLVGGLLALVIQLFQTGWLYRPQRPAVWLLFLQDALCVSLVLLAFDAPQQGGLIALLLLWLIIRNSAIWRHWYLTARAPTAKKSLPQHRQFPD